MLATLTRADIRANIRRKLGEPQGIEKNWLDIQLNEDIQDALDDIAGFGVIRGYVDFEADELTTDFDIPEEILQLTLIIISGQEYFPCNPGDAAYLADIENVAYVNAEEDGITLPAAVAVGTSIRFVGALMATQLTATVVADDTTVLNLDNRYKKMLLAGSMMNALTATEDNYRVHANAWAEELARYGLASKLARRVAYHRPYKIVRNHCRY